MGLKPTRRFGPKHAAALAGETLLVQTEKGEVLLLEIGPEGAEELASLQVFSGKTWNPPALAGKYLVLRSHEEAVVYELPLKGD